MKTSNNKGAWEKFKPDIVCASCHCSPNERNDRCANHGRETYNIVQYDNFVRGGLSAGFIDDQIDFLWDSINLIAKNR